MMMAREQKKRRLLIAGDWRLLVTDARQPDAGHVIVPGKVP